MSHSSLRKEARSQQAAKVRAYGGTADAAEDRKMIEKAVAQHESNDHPGKPKTKLHLASGGAVEGEEAPERPDRVRRAKGGPAKHGASHSTKGTHVNVIVAPRGDASPPSRPGMGSAPMPPPMAPPHPPMGGPPMMPPGAAPTGMPPGMAGGMGGGKPFKRGGVVDHAAGGGLGRLEKSADAKRAGDMKENSSVSDPDGENKPVTDSKGMERGGQ